MVMRDVSDLRKAERALRETNAVLIRSNQALTQLSHSLSHDLKEPLRIVSCYSDLLVHKCSSALDDSGREYIRHIRDGCARMENLLSALLDYYRAGTQETEPNACANANSSVQEALGNLRQAIRESAAIVQISELPVVAAHPTAVLQIFQNLIANSLRYRSSALPRVCISAKMTDSFWCFRVDDNGIGFDSTRANAIFELFQRAHGRERSGSGIGLATCRRLVEQYGGRIWADSQPGLGSTFWFTLPAVDGASPGVQ